MLLHCTIKNAAMHLLKSRRLGYDGCHTLQKAGCKVRYFGETDPRWREPPTVFAVGTKVSSPCRIGGPDRSDECVRSSERIEASSLNTFWRATANTCTDFGETAARRSFCLLGPVLSNVRYWHFRGKSGHRGLCKVSCYTAKLVEALRQLTYWNFHAGELVGRQCIVTRCGHLASWSRLSAHMRLQQIQQALVPRQHNIPAKRGHL